MSANNKGAYQAILLSVFVSIAHDYTLSKIPNATGGIFDISQKWLFEIP